MAQITCTACGKTADSDDYRVKRCTACGSWYCYLHQGQYKAQCTTCRTYTLKNLYGR